jgi:hypothetical protein
MFFHFLRKNFYEIRVNCIYLFSFVLPFLLEENIIWIWSSLMRINSDYRDDLNQWLTIKILNFATTLGMAI